MTHAPFTTTTAVVLAAAAATLPSLAPSLAAQTVMLPAGVPAAGNDMQTSHWRGPRRHQVIFHPQAIPARSGPITSVLLRVDEAQFLTTPLLVDVSLVLGSAGVPLPENASETSFAANLGTGATVAFPLQRVTVPPGASALIALPLLVPFTPAPNAPLLVQLEFVPVANQGPNPIFVLDAHGLPNGFWTTSGATSGPACPAAGQWSVFRDGENDELAFRWQTVATPATLPAVFFAGTSSTSWNGLQLPFGLAPLGAPGCALQTSIEATWLTELIASPNGSVLFAGVPLPRNPVFAGANLFAQALVIDPTANAAGIRGSELRRETLLAVTPLLAVHALAPFDPANPSDVIEIAYRSRAIVVGLQ